MKFTRMAAAVGAVLMLTNSTMAQETLHLNEEQIYQLLGAKLRLVETLGYHPKLVEAVIEQNRVGLTQSVIDQRDAEWQDQNSLNVFKNQLLNTRASRVLRDLVETSHFITEAFLTDDQGANVAAFPATSDYWQGDEEKWAGSFNGGDGQLIVGPLELDESTKEQQVQISAPMRDSSTGETVGVLVVGVAVNSMAAIQ